MNRSLRHVAGLALAVLMLTGCGRQPSVPAPADDYRPSTVRDVEQFPQNLAWFAARAGGDTLLRDPARAAEDTARFRRLFYAAWAITRPGKGNADFFRAELTRRGTQRGYAENLQPWDEKRWKNMERNADWSRFPSLRLAAVTVRSTSLRLAPTHLPRFERPSDPGEGYPFDMFQQTALPVGFPLMILHRSQDGAWYYGESALASGWLPAEDIAQVDETFQTAWSTLPLAAVIRDNTALIGTGGDRLATANLGAVLPLVRDEGSALRVLVPGRDAKGRALLETVRLDKSTAVRVPLPLTPDRLAAVGADLMGQPYGWGGLNGDRDCSAMMRDLFTPFGVWLPRNSGAQARAGVFTDFSADVPEARESRILRDGRPFATLLWLPGHIGLYVGEYQGQAAFFHNLWGLRTFNKQGKEGRHVLGRAVITSTRPGHELPQVPDKALLLNRMKGMTFINHE